MKRFRHAGRRAAATVALGLLSAAASAAPDTRPSLCAPAEVAIFSCALKTGRIVSLCASPDLTETTGSLRYLYGRKGPHGRTVAPELVYPAPGTPPREAFSGGIIGAGGGDFIRFRRGGTSYTLESIIVKNGPEVNGLRVEQAGRTLLESHCRDWPLGEGGFDHLYRAKLPTVPYYEE